MTTPQEEQVAYWRHAATRALDEYRATLRHIEDEVNALVHKSEHFGVTHDARGPSPYDERAVEDMARAIATLRGKMAEFTTAARIANQLKAPPTP